MCRRLLTYSVVCLFLLSSLLAVLAPAGLVLAQFEALKWSPIPTPSDEGFVVVNPSELSALELASPSVWYAADIPNSGFYRTEDAGLSWQDDILDALLDADPAPVLPVWAVAAAPDDPAYVVAVTDGRQEVYVSSDGGLTWGASQIATTAGWDPALLIADIAVSPIYTDDNRRDVAVATRLPDGSAAGDVWVLRVGVLGTWTAQGLDMDVSSVAFSPDYRADETIVAVASDLNATYLVSGYRNTTDNSTLWQVTDPYFVELSRIDEDSPTESELIYTDLAVPLSYNGDSASTRELFVSYTSSVDTDDVYRVDDWRVQRMNLKGGVKAPVFSVAYLGTRDLLVAGEVSADAATGRARIHFCDDPSSPSPQWSEPEKRPSGGYGSGVGNAIVAFVPGGAWAVCATSTNGVTTPAEWADLTLPGGPWSGNAAASPDESALSRASDDDVYETWNQISLIDTDIDQLCDYSLWLVGTTTSLPGNIVYLASAGSGLDSIWKSTALLIEEVGLRWERVDYLDSLTDDIIMRRAPQSDSGGAVYYAVRGTNLLYRSDDEGRRWEWIRDCPDDLTDVAIVSGERIYVLYDELLAIGQYTKVREWYVWDWKYDIDTGLKSGNTLAFHGNSFIFVGDDGDEGEIAVSTDGGETFGVLEALPFPGPVHMVLDEDFGRNRLLYAATESGASGIYRWTVGGTLHWMNLNPPDSGFTGLGHIKGTLYGAFGEGVDRTLVPRDVSVRNIDWDRLTVGLTPGTDFRPATLRVTAHDDVSIWAIDDRSYDFDAEVGRMWVYADTFVLPTPWPLSPALGEILPCDVCDCGAECFCFEWKPLPKATTWDIWFACDEEFQHVGLMIEDYQPQCCESPGICTAEIPMTFECGETYYWQVRATGTTEGEGVHSRWSPPMHFLVRAGSTIESMHVSPILVSPEAGASGVNRTPGFTWTGFPSSTLYEFQLAVDGSFSTLLVRQELERTAYVYPGMLEWGSSYFWRVRALQPYPSEWSAASFTVLPEPQPQESPPPPLEAGLLSVARADDAPPWVWLVVGVLLLLIVCVIAYTMVSRRV